VRLAEGISNADGILGRPGGADLNFHDSHARFYGGPQAGDLVIANRPMVAGIWTHVAVSRDQEGLFRVFLDGELDGIGTKKYTNDFSKLDLGRTSPPQQGTQGELFEFRLWNYARSNIEIRSSFRRRLDPRSKGLVEIFPQGGDPSKLKGGARIAPLASSPKLLDEMAAAQQEKELARFRTLAEKAGNASRGEPLFKALCLSCHTVGGQGGGVAPPLDGSANRDLDSLLRAVVTPNAAFEPGYRTYRLETHDGEMYEGFLVKTDDLGTTLGFMGGSQIFIEAKEIRRGRFLDRSFMFPGLLDAMDEQLVADLFAYIANLK
jgi:putative heme-binding domain-containing protein